MNNSRGAAALETVARSLEACAYVSTDCRKCHKAFGLGCARDLKLEAAALLKDLARAEKEGEKSG